MTPGQELLHAVGPYSARLTEQLLHGDEQGALHTCLACGATVGADGLFVLVYALAARAAAPVRGRGPITLQLLDSAGRPVAPEEVAVEPTHRGALAAWRSVVAAVTFDADMVEAFYVALHQDVDEAKTGYLTALIGLASRAPGR